MVKNGLCCSLVDEVVLEECVKYLLWFEAGIGNDVLEQSEETKLQCVVKTSEDPTILNGVSYNRFCLSCRTHPRLACNRYC